MARPSSTPSTAAARSARPPFGLRFKAWWRGYNLVPRTSSGEAPPAPKPKPLPPPHEIGWDQHRVRLVQDVWGDGCIGPRAIEEAVELVAPCCLDSSMSLLDVGAGLGAPDREIVRRFGVWVTGLESERLLAEEGSEQAREDGIGKKAPISLYDTSRFETLSEHYDCVLSRTAIHMMKDKRRALAECAKALKPGGHIVMTDYILGDGVEEETVQDFTLMQGAPPSPLEVYREGLGSNGLDLRIAADVTEDHVAAIKEGWYAFLAAMQEDKVEVTSVEALSAESARWMGRLEHLQSGALRCYRFHAIKASE